VQRRSCRVDKLRLLMLRRISSRPEMLLDLRLSGWNEGKKLLMESLE
jgi:hypothetical protein